MVLPAWRVDHRRVDSKCRSIATKKKLLGAREVRIAFRKVFPYEIFKAVVYGPDACTVTAPPTWIAQRTEDRDWW